MDTIVGKLRLPGLNMKLNEMCDIVGCRVIASDIEAVRQISAAIENRLNVKPETGVKDYIAHPKQTAIEARTLSHGTMRLKLG